MTDKVKHRSDKSVDKSIPHSARWLLIGILGAIIAAGMWGLGAGALIVVAFLAGWGACTAHAREEGYEVP